MINIDLSVSKGLKSLEFLAKFPKESFPAVIDKGYWFHKLGLFLSVYFNYIEPYWIIVEKYIKEHREEVYVALSDQKEFPKQSLTFEEAYAYIKYWQGTDIEKFYQRIGFPAHIAYKLSNSDKGAFFELLSSMKPTSFLKILWQMNQLECGEYNNIGSHLLDLGHLRRLFCGQYDDLDRCNIIFRLIIDRLGVKDRILLAKGTTKRIRKRKETHVIYFPCPSFEEDNIFNPSVTEQKFSNYDVNMFASGGTTKKTFSQLKSICRKLVDRIVFQSVYENQIEIKSNILNIKPDEFDYDFFLDGFGGIYNILEDEWDNTGLSDLLGVYWCQIQSNHKLLTTVLPVEISNKLDDIIKDLKILEPSKNSDEAIVLPSLADDLIDDYKQVKTNTGKENTNTISMQQYEKFINDNFTTVNIYEAEDYDYCKMKLLKYIGIINNKKTFEEFCYLLYPKTSGQRSGQDLFSQFNKHLEGNFEWKLEPKDLPDCAKRICDYFPQFKQYVGKEKKFTYNDNKLRVFIAEKATQEGFEWIKDFIKKCWVNPKCEKQKKYEKCPRYRCLSEIEKLERIRKLRRD